MEHFRADSVEIRPLRGNEIAALIPDLVELRVRVFREFPYLYDGDEEYERRYLAKYAASQNALVVAALKGASVIGASTALPLIDADEEFQQPFVGSEYSADQVYYFGESLLDAPYRGRGIGNRFFDERESFARKLGFRVTAFCAVVRSDDHPRRPTGYRPLDGFWTKRGYIKRPDLVAYYEWKDLDDTDETTKPLVFWIREAG